MIHSLLPSPLLPSTTTHSSFSTPHSFHAHPPSLPSLPPIPLLPSPLLHTSFLPPSANSLNPKITISTCHYLFSAKNLKFSPRRLFLFSLLSLLFPRSRFPVLAFLLALHIAHSRLIHPPTGTLAGLLGPTT